MDADRIRERLQECNLAALAERLDIKYYALWHFATGRSRYVDIEMMDKLKSYFSEGVSRVENRHRGSR